MFKICHVEPESSDMKLKELWWQISSQQSNLLSVYSPSTPSFHNTTFFEKLAITNMIVHVREHKRLDSICIVDMFTPLCIFNCMEQI